MLFRREKTAWTHKADIFDAAQERKRAVQLAFVPIMCLQRQVVLVTRMILRLKTRVLLMGAKWWA